MSGDGNYQDDNDDEFFQLVSTNETSARQRWTPAEDAALRTGLALHGASEPNRILNNHLTKEALQNRNNVQCKDRIRTILRPWNPRSRVAKACHQSALGALLVNKIKTAGWRAVLASAKTTATRAKIFNTLHDIIKNPASPNSMLLRHEELKDALHNVDLNEQSWPDLTFTPSPLGPVASPAPPHQVSIPPADLTATVSVPPPDTTATVSVPSIIGTARAVTPVASTPQSACDAQRVLFPE